MGDESHFYQDGRHRRPPQDPEGILRYAPAPGDGTAFHRVGDILGENETVLQMGVLHQGEKDIGLRIGRVESLVLGLVVVFQEDHGVLALHQVQILAEKVSRDKPIIVDSFGDGLVFRNS